jgi:hypothetical protein
MKYKAFVTIHETREPDPKVPTTPVSVEGFPVHGFEVNGGAARIINLDATDDISITSEFEQARRYENIILYLPPAKDFSVLKLVELRNGGIKHFNLLFEVDITSSGTKIQSVSLYATGAWLQKYPTPVGKKAAFLSLAIGFHGASLVHGRLDRKKHVYNEEDI